MLTSLHLENFRGFENHELPLNKLTIIVGKNNAGKSTVVEALRLISIVSSRYKNLAYKASPAWTGLSSALYGVTPSIKNIEINFDTIFHRYQDPPAIVTATFSDNATIIIYIFSEERIFSVIRDCDGKIVKSKSYASTVDIPIVAIMPQVSPVQKKEVTLNRDYVLRAASSTLASSHFRNQLYIYSDFFEEFKENVDATWPGVQVVELAGGTNLPGNQLYLDVRNEDFVGEVSVMGHGLQMWLQTMWFLTRSKNAETIILDEPDVYMHADLQRKIIRLLKNRYKQVLITTHSTEIMSEVEPNEILVIDKKQKKSTFVSSIPVVQTILERIGSAHNIHLTRLWSSQKFILVEGKDIKLFKEFQNILFPNSDSPIDAIPNMSIGGWGGWRFAIGSSSTLKNAVGNKIKTYCVFDSDYHLDAEILGRYKLADEKDIQLHIWRKKEIENYLINPDVICRVINSKIKKNKSEIATEEKLKNKIKEFSDSMEDDVFDAISAEVLSDERSLGSSGANKKARDILSKRKTLHGGLEAMVSGKELISKLSEWSKNQFGVSFSPATLAKSFTKIEVDQEIKDIIGNIESSKPIIEVRKNFKK